MRSEKIQVNKNQILHADEKMPKATSKHAMPKQPRKTRAKAAATERPKQAKSATHVANDSTKQTRSTTRPASDNIKTARAANHAATSNSTQTRTATRTSVNSSRHSATSTHTAADSARQMAARTADIERIMQKRASAQATIERLKQEEQSKASEPVEAPKGNRYKKAKRKKSIGKRIFNFFIYSGVLMSVIVLFVMYGPFNGFRDWYITTAMTTMNHQYLATWFYSSETIADVQSRNRMEEIDLITDPTLVTTTASTNKNTYADEYEREILQRDPNHPNYKIIKIKESSYTGYLAVIYDPSTIQALVTSKINEEGQYLTDMAEEAGATIAINGGVFTGLSTSTEDLKAQEIAYGGNGGKPQGITISKGEVITNTPYNGAGGLIGFTEDNKLILGKMTLEQAQKLKVRDAVTCGPFLIINGKASTIVGNGGWGTAPRTAIAQRQDGVVLMLSIDGRRATMPGATMQDLVKIMQRYGAYNASALDGGTSTAMVENGKLINDPIDSTGAHATRPIATGFGAVFKKK